MDIKTILQEKFKEHLSENSLNDIVAAFETVVQEKVSAAQAELIATNESILEQKANELAEQRAALQVESALLRIDEEHSAKLQHLLESIDADHTAKLQNFIDVVDADHIGLTGLAGLVGTHDHITEDGASRSPASKNYLIKSRIRWRY